MNSKASNNQVNMSTLFLSIHDVYINEVMVSFWNMYVTNREGDTHTFNNKARILQVFLLHVH